MKSARLPLALLLCVPSSIPAQVRHTSVPLADAVTKALDRQTLTQPGAEPFHVRVLIAEPDNPQSPYTGSIEEWWASPAQWRREVR